MSKLQEWTILGIALFTYSIGLIAYPFLPERIPSHWVSLTTPNDYGSKLESLFIPVTAIFFTVFALLIKQVNTPRLNTQFFLLRLLITILALMVMIFQIVGGISNS